jgi:hypothetical protein
MIGGIHECPISEIVIPRSVEVIDGLAACAKLQTVFWRDPCVLGTLNGFGSSRLASVAIPTSVREIKHFAFVSCASLSEVRFATDGQLQTIDGFSATNLASIEIPDTVIEIGCHAFEGCRALTTVTFGPHPQVKRILGFARSGILEFVVPRSVEVIGGQAFLRCPCLRMVTIEDNSCLQVIGESDRYDGCRELPFGGCPQLTSIRFGMESRLLRVRGLIWTRIESITIPDSVEHLTGFDGSTGLTDVRFGPGSRLLKLFGFCNCPLLTSITIPDTVFEIAGFNAAPRLSEVRFGESSHLVKISGFNGTAIECMDLPDSVEIIEGHFLKRSNHRPAVLRVGDDSRLRSLPCGRGLFIVTKEGFISKRRRASHLRQCPATGSL